MDARLAEVLTEIVCDETDADYDRLFSDIREVSVASLLNRLEDWLPNQFDDHGDDVKNILKKALKS